MALKYIFERGSSDAGI